MSSFGMTLFNLKTIVGNRSHLFFEEPLSVKGWHRNRHRVDTTTRDERLGNLARESIQIHQVECCSEIHRAKMATHPTHIKGVVRNPAQGLRYVHATAIDAHAGQ